MTESTEITFQEFVETCAAEGRPLFASIMDKPALLQAGVDFLAKSALPLALLPEEGTPPGQVARRPLGAWHATVATFSFAYLH